MGLQALKVAILLACSLLPQAQAATIPPRLPLPAEAGEKEKLALLQSLKLAEPDARIFKAGTIIKLDATYYEGISLRDALVTALNYSLPIKISKENWNYQRYQLVATLAGAAPTYTASLSFNRPLVQPNTVARSQVFLSEIKYPVFLGGTIIYDTLAQYYRNLAWKKSSQATISDKLLEVFKLYNNLCLQNVLLQIQSKSVQLAERFLQIDQAMYEAGVGTQYNIMKSRNQYFAERESYAKQEATTRIASISLAEALNVPMASCLEPADRILKPNSLLGKKLKIEQCLDLALKHRPELRQYELFRLAAARSVQSSASSLYPQLSCFTAFTQADVTVIPSGNGDQLNGEAQGQVAAAEETEGTVVTNTALNQTASISPGNNNTGTDGANTDATEVAGGGGTPIANVQGGSLVTSGAVAPTFGASAVTGKSSSSNIDGADTASAGVFPGVSRNNQLGLNFSWSLTNMGFANLGNILSARALSRQSMLQANQELQLVTKDVYSAYTKALCLERELDNAASTTASATEALRFAFARAKAGIGNKLEIIYARRDYISALTSQAKITADYNLAQAQLLREMGLISVASLTQGLSTADLNKSSKDKFIEW